MGVNALGFGLGATCTTLDDPELDERLVLLELFPLDTFGRAWPFQKSPQEKYWKLEGGVLPTLSLIHP